MSWFAAPPPSQRWAYALSALVAASAAPVFAQVPQAAQAPADRTPAKDAPTKAQAEEITGRPDRELNLIGNNVDEALTRLEKFLDEAMITDSKSFRIVHGFGTGQLRRAVAEFLKKHPLVAHYGPAPENQGGGGATVVELKE